MKSLEGIRILYLNANNPEVGGSDLCLFKMAKEAQFAGMDPIVILRKETEMIELYQNERIDVSIKSMVRLRATSDWFSKLKYIFEFPATVYILYKFIKSHHIDLIHTNDFIDVAGNVAAFLTGKPSVHHIRIIVEHPNLISKLFKILSLIVSTKIICVSKAVCEVMYPKPNNKIAIIYDWIDIEAARGEPSNASILDELGLDNDIRLIACIGRLDPIKGQRLFLEAAEIIASKYTDLHFLIIGGITTGKEYFFNQLNELKHSLTCKERITIMGYRRDVFNILRQISVVVQASIIPEAFGLVVMEAMYSGVIVVAPNAGGIKEQVINNETGFLYQPGDPSDMANKIIYALECQEKEEIKRRAQELVRKKFNRKESISRLFEIYRNLLGYGI